jgi:hypothetical protein
MDRKQKGANSGQFLPKALFNTIQRAKVGYYGREGTEGKERRERLTNTCYETKTNEGKAKRLRPGAKTEETTRE